MPPENEKPENEPDLKTQFEALKADNDRLKAELDKSKKPPPKDEEDLLTKSKNQRDDESKRQDENKKLEAAFTFNLRSEEFLKMNKGILPSSIEDFFKVAEKEKYDSAVQKANAIKSSIIQEFFSIQANLDLLTNKQKIAVEDYLKLTKNGKEERALDVYDNIFEPSLEMLRRIKKAEELNRTKNGFGDDSDSDREYRDRMQKLSNEHYTGVKK